MHDPNLPRHVVDRLIARRGRLNAYERLDAARTALVVIDMQNAFLAEGLPSEIPIAREIVPNINRLADAVRRTGGVVAWVRLVTAPTADGGWPTFYQFVVDPRNAAEISSNLNEGTEGCALWPGLDTREDDLFVTKTRFSAFLQGSSDIEAELRARGADTVLVTGTVTNVCCESSARDAMQLGFKTVMVSDANAARTDAEHTATLSSFIHSFGDVRPTSEVVGLLEESAIGDAAAE